MKYNLYQMNEDELDYIERKLATDAPTEDFGTDLISQHFKMFYDLGVHHTIDVIKKTMLYESDIPKPDWLITEEDKECEKD